MTTIIIINIAVVEMVSSVSAKLGLKGQLIWNTHARSTFTSLLIPKVFLLCQVLETKKKKHMYHNQQHQSQSGIFLNQEATIRQK